MPIGHLETRHAIENNGSWPQKSCAGVAASKSLSRACKFMASFHWIGGWVRHHPVAAQLASMLFDVLHNRIMRVLLLLAIGINLADGPFPRRVAHAGAADVAAL
jgi:hypothetical protein